MGKNRLSPHHEMIAEELCIDKTIHISTITGFGIDYIINEYLNRNLNRKILILFSNDVFLYQYIDIFEDITDNHIKMTHNKFNHGKHMQSGIYDDHELILLYYGNNYNRVRQLFEKFKHKKKIIHNPSQDMLWLKNTNDVHFDYRKLENIKLLERKYKIRKLIKLTM